VRPVPDTPTFDCAALRELGWADAARGRAVRSGRLVRLRRGQFSLPGQDDPRAAALAAGADVSGSAISDRSALLLHRLPIVGERAPVPELTVPPNGTGDTRGCHLYRASLPPEDLVAIDGADVTSAARTVVDVARHRSTATAVAAIDAALHRELATLEEIEAVLRRCWNWPGIRRAQHAVQLADGRAESPLESISRLAIRRLGLPTPDLQPVVRHPAGYALGRLDFYWDEFGVAGEADGRAKYADGDGAYPAEKARQERMEDLGVTFARWGWRLATTHPQALRIKIEAAFTRGTARDRSGPPRGWSISPSEPVGRGERRQPGEQ
jgi:hypothetical protein